MIEIMHLAVLFAPTISIASPLVAGMLFQRRPLRNSTGKEGRKSPGEVESLATCHLLSLWGVWAVAQAFGSVEEEVVGGRPRGGCGHSDDAAPRFFYRFPCEVYR
jgi:hypothetical protein